VPPCFGEALRQGAITKDGHMHDFHGSGTNLIR
jgi:hypothetical protein